MSDFNFTKGNVKDAVKANDVKSADLWRVPVANLVVEPGFNIRQPTRAVEDHIAWLTDQIIANGFDQTKTLTCYIRKEDDGTNTFVVVDGHNRLAATKAAIARGAEIDRLPVTVLGGAVDMAELTVNMARSASGLALTPYDLSEAVKRLSGWGKTNKEIATKLGVTPDYVGRLIYLRSTPMEVQEMVKGGIVSADVAMEVCRTNNAKEAVKKLQQGQAAAKAAGKDKVTRKSIGPNPGPKQAVDFALALAGDGLAWLRRWRDKDQEALQELLDSAEAEAAEKAAKKKAGKKAAPSSEEDEI